MSPVPLDSGGSAGVPDGRDREKRCPRCGETKPLDAFGVDRHKKDGHQGHCKSCRNRTHREDQPRRQQVKNRWRERHPERHYAHRIVEWAIESGKLVRPDACEACGNAGRVQGHHEDYSKPLEVRWLCSVCHKGEHCA